MGLKEWVRRRSQSRTRDSQDGLQRESMDRASRSPAVPPVPAVTKDMQRLSIDNSPTSARGRVVTSRGRSNNYSNYSFPDEANRVPWHRQEPITLESPLHFDGNSPQRRGDTLANQTMPTSQGEAEMSSKGMNAPSLPQQKFPAQPYALPYRGDALSRKPESTDSGSDYSNESLTPFETPLLEQPSFDAINPFSQAEVKQGKQSVYNKDLPMAITGASHPPDLRGIVDLTNTEDTTVQVKTAPTVVHELVRPETHHIRHEVITREIHTYEEHHRILPIIEVEVLPARHFIHSNLRPGELEEVPAESLPQSTIDKYNNRHWTIAETVSAASDTPLPGPRRFTAKTFEGTDGDYQEWIGEDGVPRTKTTWVHPPTIDDTLYKQGLTQAVHIP